ncbi:hypothetical protein KM043_001033 [Ampulex compressa]|nr:hypothetical protein KM043_001033 [Ampulex compressa]
MVRLVQGRGRGLSSGTALATQSRAEARLYFHLHHSPWLESAGSPGLPSVRGSPLESRRLAEFKVTAPHESLNPRESPILREAEARAADFPRGSALVYAYSADTLG